MHGARTMRALLFVCGVMLTLSACGGSPASGGSFSRESSGSPSPAGSGGSGNGTAADTLTAGIWDDNLNFDLFTKYGEAQKRKLVDFTLQEQQAASTRARSATTALDIALVVDTTGSMGDEIEWLKTEFKALAADIAAAHPSVPQRWALVHYRDEGDAYLTRTEDFTSTTSTFQASLDQLAPGGGGDFPEAPDKALADADKLQWSSAASTAKLVFWVADAPPHDDDGPAFSAAVRALAQRGVHVYPVASSGIDEVTEHAMRATAQLTLGRYVFLTDDSGVGGAHLEPTIPCYVVTKLKHAVERVVDSELSGTRVAVDPAKVLRSVGTPVDGKCELESGATAHVF